MALALKSLAKQTAKDEQPLKRQHEAMRNYIYVYVNTVRTRN